MSLGSAILRPQAFENAPAQGPSRPMDLVVEFFESLMKDPEGSKDLFQALIESGVEVLPRFLFQREEKLRLASGSFLKLFRPFVDIFQEFLGEMGDGIVDTFPALLRGLRRGLTLVRKQEAIRFLRELIHLARHDLDVSDEAVEKLFRELIEGAVVRLQSQVQADDFSDAALARFELGISLRNLEHLVLQELAWPKLDVELLTQALGDLYDRQGWDAVLTKISRVLEAMESVAEPLGVLVHSVLEARVSVGGSVGAAAADGTGTAPGPGSSTESEPISWYASWLLQASVRAQVSRDHTRIAPIPWITYKHSPTLCPYTMEQIAFHSSWAVDALDLLAHLFSAEQNDWLANILNGAWDTADLLAITAGQTRIPSGWQWVATIGATFLGSLESMRCSGKDDVAYPFSELGLDVGETILYKRWSWLLRECLLSTLTLINHDPDKMADWVAAGSPKDVTLTHGAETTHWPAVFNHNQFHGFCYGIGEIMGFTLPAILAHTDRENYGFINKGPTAHMVGCAFGGLGINWASSWLSLLLCRAMAGQFPNDTVSMILLPTRERYFWTGNRTSTGEDVGRFIFMILLNSPIEWLVQVELLYLFGDGNTSGGTYAFVPGWKGSAQFPGYAENSENSPYKLPWNAGDKQQCVQGNLGIWNHYPANGFLYAYDFSHDAGTEVLNCREGIITDVVSANPNNESSKNSIEVMALTLRAADAPRSLPFVPHPKDPSPTALPSPSINFAAYETGTQILNSTKFPPFWDVNGDFWPLLPGSMPLTPFAVILPVGAPPASEIPTDSRLAFLDPVYDRGLKGLTYTQFENGTLVPLGVVFAPGTPNPPPVWAPMYRAGTTFAAIQDSFTTSAIPSSATISIGVPVPAGMAYLDDTDGVSTIPTGVELPPDCGAMPAWLPGLHPATPLYLPGTEFVKYTSPFFNAGTEFIPKDTPFPDASLLPALPGGGMPSLIHTWMTPAVFAFLEYQHGLQNFVRISDFPVAKGQPDRPLPDLFDSSTLSQIRGLRVPQGRPIMLSGDTGTSLFNHLHTQVTFDSNANSRTANFKAFTIPFVFADATHRIEHSIREVGRRDGVPCSMTWYESKNKKPGSP